MTAAFVVVVHAEFQPDPSDETNALLRMIIYNLDNTAFGGEVPTVPLWSGPPSTTVQVQAILLASLSVSLLAAFLAMLGRQWLNRCIPADIPGTIIERCQYRQRKLDGIVDWYFDNVMELLPLMLQVALLLLGCALSRYLWGINTTVASVVIGITAFGLLFYLFIVVAGAVSVNCPYQTPGANFVRHIPDIPGNIPHILLRVQTIFRSVWDTLRQIPNLFHHIWDTLRQVADIFRRSSRSFSILRSFPIKESLCYLALTTMGDEFKKAHRSPHGIAYKLLQILFVHILLFPLWLIVDACKIIIWLSVVFVHWVQQPTEPQTERKIEQQAVIHLLNLRCISWALQMSVDEPVRVSALEYLATMTPDDCDPIQNIAGLFDILTGYVKVTNGDAMVVQGLEQLVAKSSLFFLHALSHLIVMDPMPRILEDVHRRYTATFPFRTNFDGLPFSHTLGTIHSVLSPDRTEGLGMVFHIEGLAPHGPRRRVQWDNYEPPSDVYTAVARALTKLAQFGYQRSWRGKVPRWLLRFSLHSLSQDPQPPASVVADSLSIIAIELGCGVPDAISVKQICHRYVHTTKVTITLTLH